MTLAYMATVVAVVALTMGSSQAMRTAGVEDLLALVPPLAFLFALRRSRRRPTADHPYGFHRATGIGHLTTAVALLAVGLILIEDSAMSLLRAEHPPIGTTQRRHHARPPPARDHPGSRPQLTPSVAPRPGPARRAVTHAARCRRP